MSNHREGYALEIVCGVLLVLSLVVAIGVAWAM